MSSASAVHGFSPLKCISGQTNRSSGLKHLLVGSPMSVLSFIFPNGRLVHPPGKGARDAPNLFILLLHSEEIFGHFVLALAHRASASRLGSCLGSCLGSRKRDERAAYAQA